MGAQVKVSQQMIDQGYDDIIEQVRSFQNSDTTIGYWLKGSFNPSKDIAARAIVMETGATIKVTKKMKGWWLYNFGVMLKKKQLIIPKRPFMRMTFDNNKKKIQKQIEKEYVKVLDQKATAKQALISLGAWYKGLIQLTIKSGKFAKLSGFTVAQKKSTKPLVDSGDLWRRVDHRETMK